MHNLPGTQITGTHGCKHVINRFHVHLLSNGLQRLIHQIQTIQFPQHQLATLIDILIFGLQLKPMRHFGTGAAGMNITGIRVEPVSAGMSIGVGQNLNLLTGLQQVGQRYNATIHFGATAFVANFGMDPISKIHRCRPRRQINHMAIGRKHINTIRADIRAQLANQLGQIAQLFMPFKHLAQPGNFLFVTLVFGIQVGALIQPVRADPQFRIFMHLVGTDLNFKNFTFRTNHRRVQ